MFEWKIEDYALYKQKSSIYFGDEKIYDCEHKVSREDKIAFIDLYTDGKMSYLLEMLEKYEEALPSFPCHPDGELKAPFVRQWIRDNDNKFEKPILRLMDNYGTFYKYLYGTFSILGVERCFTDSNLINHKGGSDTYNDLVDEVFHRKLKELEVLEKRHFRAHDEYCILCDKFKKRRFKTTFGLKLDETADHIYVYRADGTYREITIGEVKELLDKYEQVEALIKKLSDETKFLYQGDIIMKYMGSKSRISKYIVPIIQKYIDETNCKYYLEPFVGGANVIDKIRCEIKIGTDKNKYLIALLQRAQSGEPLYDSVPKELYDKARTAFNTGDSTKFTDWEMGNIGFLASYNGRWFDGGYAKPGYEKTKNGERFRDYYRESKDNLLGQAPNLKGVKFDCKDYTYYSEVNLKGFVIYVDPPYQNTKQYANATKFDYDEFWQTMRDWSKDNIVLISEESAPDDFECIWEQEVSRSIKAGDKSRSTEKLFKYKG